MGGAGSADKRPGRPPRPTAPYFTLHLIAPANLVQRLQEYADRHTTDMQSVVLAAIEQLLQKEEHHEHYSTS